MIHTMSMGKKAPKWKLPLDYMVQEYWIGVNTPSNSKANYIGMPIMEGNEKVGIVNAYHSEKGHELVKIRLSKPVHLNVLLSIGIPPNNIVSPYLA